MRTGLDSRFARRSGFTLIEVMIASVIGAMVIVASVTFILSMGELWGVGSEERLFKKHVRGVSRFLEQSFAIANDESTNEDSVEATGPVYWSDRGGTEDRLRQYLTFELQKSPGVLIWPEESLPYVVCSLEFDPGDGLFILWESRLEAEFGEKAPRRTLISPFVVDVLYYYYDIEDEENASWEVLREPKDEGTEVLVVPQRVELVFNYEDTTVNRQIVVPGAFGGVPFF